ncbi:MAG: molybdate ABC transporter substrate-binding protein [Lachnospiraceae bacterium]|nr:molybdate ABC transporter substrate-binding protein [Lachnospiraceae bacterium]
MVLTACGTASQTGGAGQGSGSEKADGANQEVSESVEGKEGDQKAKAGGSADTAGSEQALAQTESSGNKGSEAGAGDKETGSEQTLAQTESSGNKGSEVETSDEETEIQVFIAASLNRVMQEVAKAYGEKHPNVNIVFNADSSGTLLTQIEEGYECDVFFSAAQKQMNTLEEKDKLLVEGTRHNVVNNQVVVVTQKDSYTAVTGLKDIGKAESIALADGSVPVGRYTRVAMVALGLLPETEDASSYTTEQVSEALGGVEISEQANVSKVLAAVVEHSCQVGTTYYSDTYGYEDELNILERVSYDLTGNVIYPIAQVVNKEASPAQAAAAKDFVDFVISDEAKEIFRSYYFDTDVD